jgi:hypothetical protein
LLLDSEPEAKAAAPEGLALDGFWEKCYNAALDGCSWEKLLLSSSPSAKLSQHFSQVQSRVADGSTGQKTIEKPPAFL